MHICCSVVKLCPALCDPMDCSTPGLPVLHCLLELAQTYVHGVSDAIQPRHPLSSPSAPAFNLSQHQRLLQCFGSSHQVAEVYWGFNFSISPSSEHSGLISFKVDWFALLAVQAAWLRKVRSATWGVTESWVSVFASICWDLTSTWCPPSSFCLHLKVV